MVDIQHPQDGEVLERQYPVCPKQKQVMSSDYSGHVAIYDGNGGIVEAKGSKWGITHDRSANCKTILAIRRFT